MTICEKVLRIVELMLLINPSATEKSTTGNKPTIFINLFGHVNDNIEVHIQGNGWFKSYKDSSGNDIVPKNTDRFDFCCGDNTTEWDLKIANECISALESIYAEWKDKAVINAT